MGVFSKNFSSYGETYLKILKILDEVMETDEIEILKAREELLLEPNNLFIIARILNDENKLVVWDNIFFTLEKLNLIIPEKATLN